MAIKLPIREDWEQMTNSERREYALTDKEELRRLELGLTSDSEKVREESKDEIRQFIVRDRVEIINRFGMSFLAHVLPKNEYQNDWTRKMAEVYDEGLAEPRELLNIIRRDVRKYTLELDPNLQIEEDASYDNIYKAVETNNPELTKLYTDITAKCLDSKNGTLQMRDALRDEVERRKREKQAKLKKPTLKPLTTPGGFLRAVADPINQHMFEALTPGAMRKSDEKEIETAKLEARGMTGLREYTSVYIVESNKKDIYGVIGYRHDVGEALWEFQQKHGALALQAHIALFARAYAETDATPGEFITLRITDFCDDLQFTRKKGSHDRETKQRVLSILECLTQAQMKIMYAPPQGKSHLFAGAIWQRGITHETAEQTAKRLQWQPEAFSYAPGQYFAWDDWRNYTRNIALIGEGLLKLSSKNDVWAIHGGGYLALLSRMNGYRKQTIRVKTLLEKTGLLAIYAKHRKTSLMEEKLSRALDTLEKVGVIQKWNWSKDEFDNPSETLPGKLTSDKFFNRQIQIEYPDALKRVEKQITDGKTKHLKDNQKRKQSQSVN